MFQQVTAVAGFAYGVMGADLHVFGDGRPLYLLEEDRPKPPPDPAWLRELPSRMLAVGSRVVPFTGRQEEREDLRTWRDHGQRLAARWLYAPGGQGKTRLAYQFAADSAADGWKVVVAVHGVGGVEPSPGSQDLSLTGHRGVLLIVDYADRWTLERLTWLLRNSLLHRPDQPARVLLLARATTGWPSLQAALEEVRASLSEQQLMPLPGLGSDDRLAMFTAARNSFASIYGLDGPGAVRPPADLDHPDYGLVLTLQVAALVALDAHVTGEPRPSERDRLTRYLLRREAKHWTHLYEGQRQGLDHLTPPDVMARTVFTAALTGSLPYATAMAVVHSAESELPAARILADHTRCYPVSDPSRATGLEPLYPDRLAEDFIALSLPGHELASQTHHPWGPSRLDHLLRFSPASPVHLDRAFTFLAAAAARWPHVGPGYLYPLVRERPDLAVAAGSAALAALASVPGIDPAALEAVERLLPDDSQPEFDVAAAVITSALTRHRLAFTTDPAERARLHAVNSNRLANAGRHEEALAESTEAVSLCQQLAAAAPWRYRPHLAVTMDDLSRRLAETGRLAEAASMAEDVVSILRELAAADPDRHRSALGAALANLSRRLAGAGRLGEAIAPAREAVFLHRSLNPDDHQSELATSLDNLGTWLAETGRRDEAVPLMVEAASIRRRLAGIDPTGDHSGLAVTLNNLASRMAETGQRAEGLRLIEEAVPIWRRLAELSPARYSAELAQSLYNLGIHLSGLDRQPEAVAAIGESVAIRRSLAEAAPDVHGSDLAEALAELGPRLFELGHPEEALAAVDEAVAIQRRAAEADLGAHLARLARTLHAYAWVCWRLGVHLPRASAEIDESVRIYRMLALRLPDRYGPLFVVAERTQAGILAAN